MRNVEEKVIERYIVLNGQIQEPYITLHSKFITSKPHEPNTLAQYRDAHNEQQATIEELVY